MSNFKKFFPYIALGLVFIAGLILVMFPTLTNIEFFYRVGIAVIGLIGLAVFFFVSIANKKQNMREELIKQQTELKNYNAQQQIYNSIYSAVSKAQEDSKPKTLTCRFCNFIYKETEGKCPNCGAPPERNN